jgi:hypothetical protein
MEAPQNMDSQTKAGDARVLRVFALVYAYFIRLDPRPPSPSGLRCGCRVIRLGANDMDAVWLPELYPTRIRATGVGFIFNLPRLLAAAGTLMAGKL